MSFHSKSDQTEGAFGEVIYTYTLEQALEDGVLVKVGQLKNSKTPVVFTSNMFHEVKDRYQDIIRRGFDLLRKKDPEDSECMKLRVIEKGKLWVVLDGAAVTFMKPEDY